MESIRTKPKRTRKTRYVVILIEHGKIKRTNWIGAYKIDILKQPASRVKLTTGRYKSTIDYSLAREAMNYAYRFFPEERYILGTR